MLKLDIDFLNFTDSRASTVDLSSTSKIYTPLNPSYNSKTEKNYKRIDSDDPNFNRQTLAFIKLINLIQTSYIGLVSRGIELVKTYYADPCISDRIREHCIDSAQLPGTGKLYRTSHPDFNCYQKGYISTEGRIIFALMSGEKDIRKWMLDNDPWSTDPRIATEQDVLSIAKYLGVTPSAIFQPLSTDCTYKLLKNTNMCSSSDNLFINPPIILGLSQSVLIARGDNTGALPGGSYLNYIYMFLRHPLDDIKIFGIVCFLLILRRVATHHDSNNIFDGAIDYLTDKTDSFGCSLFSDDTPLVINLSSFKTWVCPSNSQWWEDGHKLPFISRKDRPVKLTNKALHTLDAYNVGLLIEFGVHSIRCVFARSLYTFPFPVSNLYFELASNISKLGPCTAKSQCSIIKSNVTMMKNILLSQWLLADGTLPTPVNNTRPNITYKRGVLAIGSQIVTNSYIVVDNDHIKFLQSVGNTTKSLTNFPMWHNFIKHVENMVRTPMPALTYSTFMTFSTITMYCIQDPGVDLCFFPSLLDKKHRTKTMVDLCNDGFESFMSPTLTYLATKLDPTFELCISKRMPRFIKSQSSGDVSTEMKFSSKISRLLGHSSKYDNNLVVNSTAKAGRVILSKNYFKTVKGLLQSSSYQFPKKAANRIVAGNRIRTIFICTMGELILTCDIEDAFKNTFKNGFTIGGAHFSDLNYTTLSRDSTDVAKCINVVLTTNLAIGSKFNSCVHVGTDLSAEDKHSVITVSGIIECMNNSKIPTPTWTIEDDDGKPFSLSSLSMISTAFLNANRGYYSNNDAKSIGIREGKAYSSSGITYVFINTSGNLSTTSINNLTTSIILSDPTLTCVTINGDDSSSCLIFKDKSGSRFDQIKRVTDNVVYKSNALGQVAKIEVALFGIFLQIYAMGTTLRRRPVGMATERMSTSMHSLNAAEKLTGNYKDSCRCGSNGLFMSSFIATMCSFDFAKGRGFFIHPDGFTSAGGKYLSYIDIVPTKVPYSFIREYRSNMSVKQLIDSKDRIKDSIYAILQGEFLDDGSQFTIKGKGSRTVISSADISKRVRESVDNYSDRSKMDHVKNLVKQYRLDDIFSKNERSVMYDNKDIESAANILYEKVYENTDGINRALKSHDDNNIDTITRKCSYLEEFVHVKQKIQLHINFVNDLKRGLFIEVYDVTTRYRYEYHLSIFISSLLDHIMCAIFGVNAESYEVPPILPAGIKTSFASTLSGFKKLKREGMNDLDAITVLSIPDVHIERILFLANMDNDDVEFLLDLAETDDENTTIVSENSAVIDVNGISDLGLLTSDYSSSNPFVTKYSNIVLNKYSLAYNMASIEHQLVMQNHVSIFESSKIYSAVIDLYEVNFRGYKPKPRVRQYTEAPFAKEEIAF